ncbi:MAG: peptidoglycan DD-metalloendopeptidase family protein [Clostridia bacterium]|nr:peptidoglycan DD-metalloendopeptidase family protein [Clostridia bacterium]
MNNNIILKNTYIVIILLIIFIFPISIYATSRSELENQSQELDKKIQETHTEIQGVKSQMSKELTQINRLNIQITEYQSEVEDLENKITGLESEISEKNSFIAQKEADFAEKKAILEKRLVAIYEAGNTSYLDMLLSSKGLSDFISKYYLITELTNCDNELLSSIEEERAVIALERDELNSKKDQVEQAKNTAERKKNTLNLTISEKNVMVSSLSAEEKELEAQLEELEEDKRAITRELSKYASSGGSITPVAPSAAGYISPLAGKTKANITTGFYGYKGHTGADFACSSGTPVLAVKAGTVITSTALRRSNGSYRSYGEYVAINHHDGTITLYAHMLSGSRTVNQGDVVVQGQQIGQVGSTGNSTGPHLHFEVRVGTNATAVNPSQYLP